MKTTPAAEKPSPERAPLLENLVYFARLLKANPIPTNLNDLYQKAAAESGAIEEGPFQRIDRM